MSNINEFREYVLEILEKDYTQTCNGATGTKMQVLKDCIIIKGGLSNDTLRKLVTGKYLCDVNENGNVEIRMIVIRE
jgi:hypothetical protein